MHRFLPTAIPYMHMYSCVCTCVCTQAHKFTGQIFTEDLLQVRHSGVRIEQKHKRPDSSSQRSLPSSQRAREVNRRLQPNAHSQISAQPPFPLKVFLACPLASASSHKTMCSFPLEQLSQAMMTLMGLVDRNLSFPQDCKLPGSRNCVCFCSPLPVIVGGLLRVPWTSRRSKQSILKEISPEYSLEGLTLKLKLRYFGSLLIRTDSL